MNRRSQEHIHILIVDDEKSVRNMLHQAMESSGYECSISGNAIDALKVLKEKNVDLVITDIGMPGQNGIELTRIIKEKYDSEVIVMTGFASDFTYEEILEKGANDFILKPFSIKEVLIRVKHVLKDRAIFSEWKRAEKKLKHSLNKLERVLEETVNTLALAFEKRDAYTTGHQQRVTKLACAIAKEMNLSDEQIKGLHIAGLLHDIGKISVPIDILNKPSKLNDNEFNLIKEHPHIGYDILKDVEFEQPIAQIILQHHEMMNGSGYPEGIIGEAIILQARILAVADVVEAIASHRPYRPALGINKALEEILLNRSVLYDPDVVDICLKLFNKNIFKFE